MDHDADLEQQHRRDQEHASGIPTVREETPADQIHNGLLGANDTDYVEGEMVRAPVALDVVHAEVVPGAEVKPPREKSSEEQSVYDHGVDTAMHDEEVRAQNPPIIVVD